MKDSFSILPLNAAFGAAVQGVKSFASLTACEAKLFSEALDAYSLLVFRKCHVDSDGLCVLATAFGVPERHAILPSGSTNACVLEIVKEARHSQNFGGAWHIDSSFRENPPVAAVLAAKTLPPHGGDTIWANQILAYEALPNDLRVAVAELSAVHSDEAAFGGHSARTDRAQACHPLAPIHPRTGRRSLFLNPTAIESICGLDDASCRELIAELLRYALSEEFQYRHCWRPGDIVVWDNRATMHMALNDYHGFKRVMYRVSVAMRQ